MLKAEVKIGGVYHARISGGLTTVRLDSVSPYGGWNATNTRTGRPVRIRSAAKLRGEYFANARTMQTHKKYEIGACTSAQIDGNATPVKIVSLLKEDMRSTRVVYLYRVVPCEAQLNLEMKTDGKETR